MGANIKLRGLMSGVVLILVGLAEAPDDAPNLAGTWTWKWKDAQGETHRHVLEIEGKGAKLAARERFDDEKPVKINDLKVVDKKVSFSVLRGDRRAFYSGTIDDADTINGKVSVSEQGGQSMDFGWTDVRKPAAQKP